MGTDIKVNSKSIILFDGVCNLCNTSVNFVIDRDSRDRFLFAALQSDFAKNRLQELGYYDFTLSSVLLVEGERVYKESTAALRIAKGLGGLWPLLYIMIIIPSSLRDVVYKNIARNRYKWFGKRESCRVPEPAVLRKFVGDAQVA